MNILYKYFFFVFFVFTAYAEVDQSKLKKIEIFLSQMNTLHAAIRMEIFNHPNQAPSENFEGAIWLDRLQKRLRIDYGKNRLIAKNGVLILQNYGENPQEVSTDDTPAGLLLRSNITFNEKGVIVQDMRESKGVLMLAVTYDSPAGSVPVTLYFQEQPIMLLLGWTIQNPNGSLTQLHLDPNNTHMGINIDSKFFESF